MPVVWLVIILDFIIPFVPVTALFLLYVMIAKPGFFKQWVDKIYAQKTSACH